MPKPLLAIVGRPNVGKSTLFNRLARQRIAVVEDLPGTTRDRLYADCDIWGHVCTLIDTGGFDMGNREGYAPAIVSQAQLAVDEADIIIFLTDGREEPTTLDYEVADLLRRTRKPVLLAANKVDNPRMEVSNMYALRLGEPLILSAATGIGVAELTEHVEELLPRGKEEYPQDNSIKVALVGRPNVGKSALTNRLLGFERSIVSPQAGTTRDAIDTKLEWNGQPVTLIDTAGMRRKARVRGEKTAMEYHMVLRSLRAMDRADVVIIVCESGGIAEQDTKIAGYAHEAGKAVLICVNKWDLIETERHEAYSSNPDTGSKRQRQSIEENTKAGEKKVKRTLAQKDFEGMIARYLPFISYAPIHFSSAEKGLGVEAMFEDALAIAPNVKKRVSTGMLNDTVRRAIAEHAIPSVKGRQMKIRYATQADVSPPTIILFCNHPELLHFSYVRYLENAIRKKFSFRGVPLKVEMRAGSGEMTREERLRVKREAVMAEGGVSGKKDARDESGELPRLNALKNGAGKKASRNELLDDVDESQVEVFEIDDDLDESQVEAMMADDDEE
jgi:GTP-binding protein